MAKEVSIMYNFKKKTQQSSSMTMMFLSNITMSLTLRMIAQICKSKSHESKQWNFMGLKKSGK